jgi:hypothetical protein
VGRRWYVDETYVMVQGSGARKVKNHAARQ